MFFYLRPSHCLKSLSRVSILILLSVTSVYGESSYGESSKCPAVTDRPLTPADAAYSDGRYAEAESLYQQALAQNPQDAELSAALVRTLLHEGKVSQASTQANAAVAANPHVAATLTVLAEVQLRQGQPRLAMETLDSAAAADACYARTHLIRSRVLRIDSMYASERAELQTSYDINPADPDIQHEWLRIVSPANDIEGTAKALNTTTDVDAETRQKAEATMHSMLPLLSENSQTCKVLPAIVPATLPLQPSFADVKHIDGYRLDVELPKSKGKLIVDTAASGLYISKAISDQNGFQQGEGDPPGTVHVDSVRIGPLEFRDCIVGVSDAPFAGKAAGFIGTDMFAPWLITLDYRSAKLILAPLPEQPGILPGDRIASPELAGYTPVYHRRQYLLVPVTFGNNSRRLFTLATGMRFSAMTSDTAHSLSKMTMNFTNTEQTAQGAKVQFYREVFDMQLASLPQIHQGHILELDSSVMSRNAGFEIAGMLGLDVLQPLRLHLDYRDGLVKLESTETEATPLFSKSTLNASASPSSTNDATTPACQPDDTVERPVNSAIQARVTGSLDSAHLKPGKEVFVKVVYGLEYPGCTLDEDATLYGHVTAATSSKNPDASELSLVFDHGDCTGKGKKELSLRLIGVLAPASSDPRHLHEDLPAEVAGGARSVSAAVGSLVNGDDADLNPGGPPHTIRPGIVVRMPGARLEPEGGPSCSARISGPGRSIQLGAGSELILTLLGPA